MSQESKLSDRGDKSGSSIQSVKLERQPRDGKIPQQVWRIGIMMMLMNISFVMVYSFSGLYLKHVIGVTTMDIGVLEGVCETISHSMKLISGMLSDFFRKRKGIIVFGYVFSVVSKPLMAVSTCFGLVFAAKMLERFGNGIQASPRDAIIADVAPRKKIGESYGLKRSLAYLGSFLGGICAIVAMTVTNDNYRLVFTISTVPAVAAFLIMTFCVKEPKRFDHPAISSEAPLPSPKVNPKFSFSNLKYLGRSFWLLMAVDFIFMIARMNETFLILRINDGFGVAERFSPLVMIMVNFGTTLASYPIGILGDKFNRVKILLAGVAFLVLADITMFSASSRAVMFTGILFWGIQLGATQNIFVSLIAENVPEYLRGTGFGIFWIVNAFSSFWADTLAGYVAHTFSLGHIFVSSGIIGLLALVMLAMVIHIMDHPRRKRVIL
jgi:MFS family permease